MFNFLRKQKTPEKYDDIDWHEIEGSSEGQPAHIALMYIWLASRGYIIEDGYSQDLADALSEHDLKPSEILERYADGKIISSIIKPSVVEFLNEFYEREFLSIIENNEVVQLNRTIADPPYNIEDSWENVDKACVWLDERYKQWLSRKKS